MECKEETSGELVPHYLPQARLRLADVVEREDVEEAMRLMEMSKHSLQEEEGSGRRVRPIDAVYSIVREMADPDTVRSVTGVGGVKWRVVMTCGVC